MKKKQILIIIVNREKSLNAVNNDILKSLINILKHVKNDLESPAFKLYPILEKLKIFLSNIKQVKFVRMTGSGSTIVAYFSNKKSAINGLKLVKKKFKNHWSIVSKTI